MGLRKDLYEIDFYAWCLQQAEFIKNKEFINLDFENLIEEIECLGKRERRELESRLAVLFMHILKLKFRPDIAIRSFPSWGGTIRCQQNCIKKHMLENTSLKSKLDEICINAYEKAKLDAANEGGIVYEQLPIDMPFTYEQAVNDEWKPEI